MKITIIPADKAIYVDGAAVTLIDGFDTLQLPTSVHAVQFDTEAGAGEVEWRQEPDGRKPANMKIDASAFRTNFSYDRVLAAHAARKAEMERERVAAKKATAAAILAASEQKAD